MAERFGGHDALIVAHQRYIRFVEMFPMTVTGKIQKYVLRKQIESDLGISAE